MLNANQGRLLATKRTRKIPLRGTFLQTILLVAAASAIVRLINRFVIQLFYVPSESMLPTIRVDDLLLVSRVSFQMGPTQRGAIIVFKVNHPTEGMKVLARASRHVRQGPGMDTPPTNVFIKRVVAVEGDVIEIRHDRIVLNGGVVNEPYLPGGVHMSDLAPITIPRAHVFVMGDNREWSSDSRIFGPIPEENIIGEVVLRVWPLSQFGSVHSADRGIASAPAFENRV